MLVLLHVKDSPCARFGVWWLEDLPLPCAQHPARYAGSISQSVVDHDSRWTSAYLQHPMAYLCPHPADGNNQTEWGKPTFATLIKGIAVTYTPLVSDSVHTDPAPPDSAMGSLVISVRQIRPH